MKTIFHFYKKLSSKNITIFLCIYFLIEIVITAILGKEFFLLFSIFADVLMLLYLIWLYDVFYYFSNEFKNITRKEKIILSFIWLYFSLFTLLIISPFILTKFFRSNLIYMIPFFMFVQPCQIYFFYKLACIICNHQKLKGGNKIVFYFIILLMFPVGIWFIQPKLNNMRIK
jgi:hypothetical protein